MNRRHLAHLLDAYAHARSALDAGGSAWLEAYGTAVAAAWSISMAMSPAWLEAVADYRDFTGEQRATLAGPVRWAGVAYAASSVLVTAWALLIRSERWRQRAILLRAAFFATAGVFILSIAFTPAAPTGWSALLLSVFCIGVWLHRKQRQDDARP